MTAEPGVAMFKPVGGMATWQLYFAVTVWHVLSGPCLSPMYMLSLSFLPLFLFCLLF